MPKSLTLSPLNIDWPLFHQQKAMLVAMANDNDRLTSEVEVLDGVINLLDALQDALEPETPETSETSETPEVTKS